METFARRREFFVVVFLFFFYLLVFIFQKIIRTPNGMMNAVSDGVSCMTLLT